MSVKRILACALLLALMSIPMMPSEINDADEQFQAEITYFDGIATIWGSVPDSYIADTAHVDVTIQDQSGAIQVQAYSIVGDDGLYYQDIKCNLLHADYKVEFKLMTNKSSTMVKVVDLSVDEGSDPIPVSTISLSSSLGLNVGDIHRLSCRFNPENASYKTLIWSSSNESVASVDGSGVVRAISPGEAKITAQTMNGKTASCLVTVSSGSSSSNVQNLSISASSYSLYAGGTDTITLVANLPSEVSEQSLRWSVDKSNIASFVGESVSKKTVELTGKTVGSVTVTVYSATTGQQSSVNISVVERVVTNNHYSFYLRADMMAENANYSGSRFSASDLKAGITLTSSGMNAGEALEKALKSSGVTCEFWSEGYQVLGRTDFWIRTIPLF